LHLEIAAQSSFGFDGSRHEEIPDMLEPDRRGCRLQAPVGVLREEAEPDVDRGTELCPDSAIGAGCRATSNGGLLLQDKNCAGVSLGETPGHGKAKGAGADNDHRPARRRWPYI